MLLVSLVISLTVRRDVNTISSEKMIQSNASYRDYGVSEDAKFARDRLPAGTALLAVFGLSLLAWAVVLAPLVAILHQ